MFIEGVLHYIFCICDKGVQPIGTDIKGCARVNTNENCV